MASLLEISELVWTNWEDDELRLQLQTVIDATTEPDYCIDIITNEKLSACVLDTLERAISLGVRNAHTSQIRLFKGFVMILRNISVLTPPNVVPIESYLTYKRLFAELAFSYINDVQTESEDALKTFHCISLASIASQSVLNFPNILNFEPLGLDSDLLAFKSLSLVIDKGGLNTINMSSFKYLLRGYLTPNHEDLRTELFYKGKQELTWLLLSLCEASGIKPGVDLESFLDVEDANEKVKETRELMVTLIKELITHESFGGILCKIEKEGSYEQRSKEETASHSSVPLIFLCQLVCDSDLINDTTDPLAVISLASWSLEYFKLVSSKSEELLQKPQLSREEEIDLRWNHRKLIAILDLMATHMELNVIIKTFDEYDLIKDLIKLFQIIEQNTLKPKLKDNVDPNTLPGQVVEAGKKHFPQVKSLIVELMTSLIHWNKLNQDVVRELHGLELILNNCNLDMNEPFIKERSILCIKHLLENNAENQKFVASLEARGTEINKETDEVLTKAGFRVDIVDGKVQLRKSDERQQMEEKVTEIK